MAKVLNIYRGDGLNLYAYVKNNPVMWVDPSGYVYVIETDRGIDINETYGDRAYFPEQQEVSVPDGVQNSLIKGAYKKENGKITGDLIENDRYGYDIGKGCSN